MAAGAVHGNEDAYEHDGELFNRIGSSLDRKLGILDSLEKLNTEQEAVLGAASFDEEAFGHISGRRQSLLTSSMPGRGLSACVR